MGGGLLLSYSLQYNYAQKSGKELSENYDKFKESFQNGSLGKTMQSCLIYLDLTEHQHRIHLAVQENNFTERIIVWEYFLSFYFATNKINYARYGSYYDTMFRA